MAGGVFIGFEARVYAAVAAMLGVALAVWAARFRSPVVSNAVLIGGAGTDTLTAGQGHAVLLGGAILPGTKYDGYAALAAVAASWFLPGQTPADLAMLSSVGDTEKDNYYFGPAGAASSWAIYDAMDTVFSGFLAARDKKTLLS